MTTALVLAGKRDGAADPLATAAGLSHKCLVPVAGRAMILQVLDALGAAPDIREIVISIDDPAVLAPLVLGLGDRGHAMIRIAKAQPNLVDSVTEALKDATFPVLITTADNVLLTAAAVAQINSSSRMTADVAVAFARRGDVLSAHPDGQRRFYSFRDDAYSNCNAYWLRTPAALRAAEVFRQGGQFAKRPARIIKAFGLFNVLRFRFGLDTLAGLFRRLSRRFDLSIEAVILDDGAVAIDVDNARTQAIADQLLSARMVMARC